MTKLLSVLGIWRSKRLTRLVFSFSESVSYPCHIKGFQGLGPQLMILALEVLIFNKRLMQSSVFRADTPCCQMFRLQHSQLKTALVIATSPSLTYQIKNGHDLSGSSFGGCRADSCCLCQDRIPSHCF